MSEEDKGFGPWSKVPQWDGRFTSWRKFKRDVSWWVSSIDLAGTAKYNLAARFLLRQDGVARQRGEEFTPADLAYRPAETFVDPDTGDEVEVSPPDYLAGLNKLLSAWESMTGQTALDKRGELRQTFYLDLQRRAGERVSEFATRFRSLVADLRAEGVQLHDNELGWWLKQKLGLDALRKQLLETALAGSEDYALIETEVLRLFRDLHEQDPLKRRFEPGTPKLTIRRLFQHQHRGPSSSSSVAPSSMKSSASSVSSRAPSFRSAQSYRQANVTEILEEDDAEDADGGVDGEVGEQIEEVLQSEAEILACELEEAEAEGVDPNLIENLESGIEAAAETLVTMREARQQLASVRKDRGYGKFADGKDSGKKGSSQVQARKTSGKHPCFDCNQLGHWAGDAECTKPGAGLGRRGASAKKSAKQVRIAETSRPSAEHSADITETVSGLPMHDVLVTEELPVDHDVLVVAAGPEALNLEQALAQNLTRSALVSDQQSPLPADKELVGALDSACNRTCTGTVWLEQYLAALKNAPKFVQDLIHCEPESENFRFGNNGVVPSIQRWRLPTLIGQTLVLIWVSLVPIGTLGCLIGRDFMEAVGAVLDFSRRTMTCSLFYSGTLKLRQMVAGHFMLDLLPSRIAEWGAPPQCRWRRVGQDGVLELQMDRKSWTKHKLQAQVRRTHEHEHQLTEQAIQASSFTTHVDHDVLVSSSSDGMTADNLLAPVAQARCDRSCDGERRLVSSSSRRMSSMAKVHPSHTGSKGLASEGHRSQPRSKARIALLALSISCCQIVCRLACAGGVYDDQSNLAPPSFGDLFDQDDHYSSWGMPSNSRPRGLQAGIPGRCSDEHGHWYGHWLHWSTSCSSEGSSKGSSRRSSTSSSPGPTASDVEGAHWTPWRPPNVARRSSQVGHDPSHPCRGQGHGADFTHQVSTSSDGLDGWSEDRDTVCSWNGCVEGSSSTCCFEVLTADAGKIRADNRDLVDHGCQRASDGCGWRAGGQLVGSVAGLTNKSNGSSDQSRVNDFRFKWKHKPKPGVQQMISQAWDRHCRDRTAVSKDRHEVFEVMLEQWNHEVQLGMNEIFLAEFQFPDPFVMEVYTDVEPIAREARRRGLRAAKSMTLHTGWDFRNKSSRVQALKWIRENKPYVVILAFPCGPWSALMHLNDKTNIQKLRGEAKELVLFAIEVAKLQLSQNCHLLIENPQGSAAWLLDEMIEFLQDPRLRVVVVDQCRFGLCNDLGELHKKPTRLATSSQALISLMLNKRCTGDHSHAPVIGGSKVTRPAGHYSLQFAKAVVSGFMMQFDHETKMLNQDPEPSFEALTAEGLPSSSLAVDGGLSGSDDEIIDAEVGQKKAIIPSSIRAAVMRLHRNTGHRSERRLARALVLCGAPPEAVLAAKMIQCDECSERRAPKTRRPATLPSVSDVGAQAHIDIVMLEDAFKQIYPVIHVVDKVSRYQMASVMPNKTTAEVVKFLTASWIPLMGRPQILVADQGREFLSYEFEEFCGSRSIFLYHVGVQCPWQNGICERAGASLKAITGALVRAHSIGGYDEMAMSVGEATAAYNADINEEGVSPLQAVTGRQQPAQGDVLSGVGSRLAEHSLIDSKPTLARQVALRETARVAMVRMHFSRGLRRAELARARTTSLKDFPQPGDLCYFWRASKYNPLLASLSFDVGLGPRWWLQLRGRKTVRLVQTASCLFVVNWPSVASSMFAKHHHWNKFLLRHGKRLSKTWSMRQAINQTLMRFQFLLLEMVMIMAVTMSHHSSMMKPLFLKNLMMLQVLKSLLLNLKRLSHCLWLRLKWWLLCSLDWLRQEALQSYRPRLVLPGGALWLQLHRRPSNQQLNQALLCPLGRRRLLERPLERARSLDRPASPRGERGEKRSASQDQQQLADAIAADPTPAENLSSADQAQPAFEALQMTWEQLCKLSNRDDVHPLLRLQAQTEQDRRAPLDSQEFDHGSWDGRWSFMCERDWLLLKELGEQFPVGSSSDFDVMNVQASRKEYHWKQLSAEDRAGWSAAALKGWEVYTDNKALEVLDMKTSAEVRRRLAKENALDKILRPRFVLTDKHYGVRTHDNWLPRKYSARMVVPGFRDRSNLEGRLRRDAPTGRRISQHLLFCLAAANQLWSLLSGDIKSAFMKGDLFSDESRELYISGTDPSTGPSTPLKPGQLARVCKAVFGLADAPRAWWLKLSKTLEAENWKPLVLDGAAWLLWDVNMDFDHPNISYLHGMVVAHVDDLLFTGDAVAVSSFQSIGRLLGFGSQEADNFQWCGKRIRRADDKTIRVSMIEYHQNLKEIYVSRARKSNPQSELSPSETRQLRALLGSLQWLVAQLRFDLAFPVSALQGERPIVQTMLKANSLMKEFQRDCQFELIFRPIDLATSGIMVVCDVALGNVTLQGCTDAPVLEKVYSQACYFVLVADRSLMSGGVGSFNILDARSHRVPRVCRSTYAAETLGCEEAFDVGILCRGFLGAARGLNFLGRAALVSLNMVDLTVVVDAKDVHDKGNSDTSTYGAQKSMAFTVAWLRSQLRQPRTCLRWTSTENMWVDGGTKIMDLTHMRRTMQSGRWSVSYSPQFVKQVYKASKKVPMAKVTAPWWSDESWRSPAETPHATWWATWVAPSEPHWCARCLWCQIIQNSSSSI